MTQLKQSEYSIDAGEVVSFVDDAEVVPEKVRFILDADSSVTYECRYRGGEKVARTLEIVLKGKGASFTAKVSCVTHDKESFSLTTLQHHQASHTKSSVSVRGVSADCSRATVKSVVIIDEGIAAIDAQQVHKHILLDSGARAVSEPALEILSDDVKCSHGSAIKQIDERALFYLQSRGCTRADARQMIIDGFLR
jgi:Fe-S cluster assembly protein SufD